MKASPATTLAAMLITFAGAAFPQNAPRNPALADTLARMHKTDQVAAFVRQGEYLKMSAEQWSQFKDSVFRAHGKKLQMIFREFGYPGYDLVGKAGSQHYWNMVQHCDFDPDFQQRVLTAMEKEVKRKNADVQHFAYLTDRVALNTGRKQVYGTQVTYNTDSCQAYPRPVADSSRLNARRAAAGLEPVENYLNDMSEMHFEMNRKSYEDRGIRRPKLYAVPRSKP
ncbi:DUF6624 domain-containing protein [Chitinophaga sp. NPDC101104]|uniref:DUF6624 domain-containing protein n=1 Tax=Chitinophaga sp. NPDC101104 TaxID=3390561 RepID=UPI003D02F098